MRTRTLTHPDLLNKISRQTDFRVKKDCDVNFILQGSQYAAYRFLSFAKANYTREAVWSKVIEALATLERKDIIDELQLEDHLADAADDLLLVSNSN